MHRAGRRRHSTRGIDKPGPRLDPTGTLEQIDGSRDIDSGIERGIFDAGSHTSPRGKVHDDVGPDRLDQPIHALGITNIELHQPGSWVPQCLDQIRSLDRFGIK